MQRKKTGVSPPSSQRAAAARMTRPGEIMSKSGTDRVSEFWRLSVSKVGNGNDIARSSRGKCRVNVSGKTKNSRSRIFPPFNANPLKPGMVWQNEEKLPGKMRGKCFGENQKFSVSNFSPFNARPLETEVIWQNEGKRRSYFFARLAHESGLFSNACVEFKGSVLLT